MEVFSKAAILVAIIALGYLVKRIGWLSAEHFRPLSVIAVRITLPCVLIVSFDSFEMRAEMLWLSVFGFVVVGLQIVVPWWVERRRGRAAQAFGVLNVGSFNIGLFTIPYVGAFVGPQGVIVASMFDVGNALAATGVAYGLGLGLASGERQSPWKFVATLFATPLFPTYLVLVTMGLMDWHLPRPVIEFASTVGAANTFVALLMIGVGLQVLLGRDAYRDAVRYLVMRWMLVAVALLALWLVMPFGHAEKVVISAVLVAPMAAMMTAFTEEAGLSVPVSAFMVSITVLVAIVAMPLALVLGA